MIKTKTYFFIFVIVFALSLSLNFYYLFFHNHKSYISGFSFLDPTISNLEVEDYLEAKNEYTASYKPLKVEIQEIISKSEGEFGVYFEDLEFHSWIGINETDLFTPASLMKVTTVSAILKEVEEGELSLDKEVFLSQDYMDDKFGELYKYQGSTISIKKLIEIALIYSDNTAVRALHPFISYDRWIEARLNMGLPLVSIEESEKGIELTPKQFSNVFRSLYYSGYLSRSSSNWILELLSESEFKKGIPAGVPDGVTVSHKIGVWINEGETIGSVHDCGIVYAKKPYILCIMSEGVTSKEGNEVIEEISRTVYNYVSNQSDL